MDDALHDFLKTIPKKELDETMQKVGLASQSLVHFRSGLLDNDITAECEPAPFHHQWSDILINGVDNYCIEGYRESAKTNYVLRAFPLYSILFPSKHQRYILLVKRNQETASDKLKDIIREAKSNKWIRMNIVNIIEESASAFQLVVKDYRNPGQTMEIRIEAHGKQGSIRGASWGSLRPQIIIADDLQNKDDMDSDKILERDWDWFLDDVLFLAKNCRIFMISNNMGEKCIAERIFRAKDHFGFICEKIKRTSALDMTGIPTWAAKDTQEEILAQRDQYIGEHRESIWMRNNMCECVGAQDLVFFRSMFRYYPPSSVSSIMADSNVYLRIDPSVKKGEEHDPSAFVIFCINPDNNLFVIDVVVEHLKQSEKEQMVFNLVRRYRPVNVGIENSKEGIILIQQLYDQMPKENCFFKLLECKHGNKNKELRIEASLEPRFAAHSVWFPEQAAWLPELELQLTMFSKIGKTILHDDIIDALAYSNQHTSAPVSGAVKQGQTTRRRQRQDYGEENESYFND